MIQLKTLQKYGSEFETHGALANDASVG
jgi:hypothetical protein